MQKWELAGSELCYSYYILFPRLLSPGNGVRSTDIAKSADQWEESLCLIRHCMLVVSITLMK